MNITTESQSFLEYQKKELGLGLNSFDTAAEYTEIQAWMRLIITLLFLEKGSYMSDPNMGVGLTTYEFDFIDSVKIKLKEEIDSQIRTYLPDVPMRSVEISSTLINGETILILLVNILVDSSIQTAVVAAAVVDDRIDFEIKF